MKKSHKTIMLPTEDRDSKLWYSNDGQYMYDPVGVYGAKPQYLYFLSDDKIKKGDWVFYKSSKLGERLAQVKDVVDDGDFPYKAQNPIRGKENMYIGRIAKKIIATNDTNLTKVDEVSGDNVWTSPIPQIPQSLVKHYTKHQPKEVELEYEKVNLAEESNKTKAITNCNNWVDKLKLQNNEIVWVEPAKGKMALVKVNGTLQAEKLYTREEVERLCKSAWLHGMRTEGEKFSYWKKKNL